MYQNLVSDVVLQGIRHQTQVCSEQPVRIEFDVPLNSFGFYYLVGAFPLAADFIEERLTRLTDHSVDSKIHSQS